MKRFVFLLCALLSVMGSGCAAPPMRATMASLDPNPPVGPAGEGADLMVGGVGVGPGQFDRLRDITFGGDGRLYTLESAGRDSTTAGDIVGLGRVQVFDGNGGFVRAFSLGDDAQADNAVTDKNEDGPMNAARIAVDGGGNVYVSFPIAGIVRVFGPDGTKLTDIALPDACALARRGDGKIVAVGSLKIIRNQQWVWEGGSSFSVLKPTGIESTTPLSQSLWNVQDATLAPNGDLLVLAARAAEQYNWNPPTLIWSFDASGALLSSIGSGRLARTEDGSEPLHSLVVGRDGAITTLTYGNPAPLVRFSGDGKTITRHAGQFAWADPWSMASSYTPLALDPTGRLWVGVPRPNDPKDPNLKMRHARPVVVRANANFFASGQAGVSVSDARTLGFAPQLSSPLPFNIAYDVGKPVQTIVTLAPARRALSSVEVSFRVFDVNAQVIASGTRPLSMADDQGARLAFEWTPPRFGPYTVVVNYNASADVLKSQVLFYGVTPRYGNRPMMKDGDSTGGWEDPLRQKFCGLDLVRLHLAKGDDKLVADLNAAIQNGVIPFVQMTDKAAELTPANATRVAQLVKGRRAYIELLNEPNLQMSPADYVARAGAAYNAIKAVDPQIQVLGPATCGIKLDWLDAFYGAGGKATCDILSVHDYEGHESISPEHWRWKFGALRALMAKYGDTGKPVWQTERAIASVRGGLNTSISQAIRLTLHRDLLSSLGVPDSHNYHYYLNQGGYSQVPSYVWSDLGPLPGALAVRTRAALIDGRPWESSLNFGGVNNTLYEGECYRSANGRTLSLRNLVGAACNVDFAFTAGTRFEIYDAWGNPLAITPTNGVVTLPLGQLPTYVRIIGSGGFLPKKSDWGPDIALNASVSLQGQSEGDLSLLTNGQLETIHDGNPLGGTDGKQIVTLTGFSPQNPAIVTLQLGAPARINRVLVRGMRADNQFSALRDFDVEVRVNGAWKLVGRGGSAITPSVAGENGDAGAITFYGDDNAWLVGFDPVVADGIRLTIRDATRGFAPDDSATGQVTKTWGSARPMTASLREVEAYLAG